MTITSEDLRSLKFTPPIEKSFVVRLLLLIPASVVFLLFSEKILLQGLSDLAAQAVNQNRGDEIIWRFLLDRMIAPNGKGAHSSGYSWEAAQRSEKLSFLRSPICFLRLTISSLPIHD